MTFVAAAIGGASATVGCLLSAMIPKLAGGPTIVLAGTAFFILSMLFGTRRGIVQRWLRHARNRRRIGRDDLLRAMYEIIEARLPPGTSSVSGDEATEFSRQAVQLSELQNHRSSGHCRRRTRRHDPHGLGNRLATDKFRRNDSPKCCSKSPAMGDVPDLARRNRSQPRRS